jgi:hypothetical protein
MFPVRHPLNPSDDNARGDSSVAAIQAILREAALYKQRATQQGVTAYLVPPPLPSIYLSSFIYLFIFSSIILLINHLKCRGGRRQASEGCPTAGSCGT